MYLKARAGNTVAVCKRPILSQADSVRIGISSQKFRIQSLNEKRAFGWPAIRPGIRRTGTGPQQ